MNRAETNAIFRMVADMVELLALDIMEIFEEQGYTPQEAEIGLMTLGGIQQWMVDQIGAEEPDPEALKVATAMIETEKRFSDAE